MKLPEFLKTLSEEERNFISGLDYGQGFQKHRQELDRVINNSGLIDPQDQIWYPYEVIELGKNCYQKEHEREFVACAGIVLYNINLGIDQMNDVDIGLQVVIDSFSNLKLIHQEVLRPLLESVKNKS